MVCGIIWMNKVIGSLFGVLKLLDIDIFYNLFVKCYRLLNVLLMMKKFLKF